MKMKKPSKKSRFDKITNYVVEKSSPQRLLSEDEKTEKEAKDIVNFRRRKELKSPKPIWEDA